MYFSMIALPDMDPPALHTAPSLIWWNIVYCGVMEGGCVLN